MPSARPIALIASGTRGDLQPFIALGTGLQRAGHAVRIVAHPRFAAFVTAHNLAFAPLAGDQNELFGRPELRAALRYDAGPLQSAVATLRFLQAARPLFARMLSSAWEAAHGARAIVVSLPTHWGDQIAEALGVPCIWGLAQPVGRTATFPSPLQPFAFSLGARYNRLTHALVEYAAWLPWRALIAHWRSDTLGLRRPATIGWPERMAARGDLLLYAFSRHVVPPPPDWSAQSHVTGYWFLPREPGWQPPHALTEWLASDTKPIYLGFGGMSVHTNVDWSARMARALAQQGWRVLLAGTSGAEMPPGVFPIRDIPHDWLFPQVAAAIHHGGAGTTAAALHAGIPSVCVPFGVDQYYWGQRIAALGCAPEPLPQRTLTTAQLVAAAERVTSEPRYAANAATLGALIRSEQGIERAVTLIGMKISKIAD